jgi:hypothetical protein
MPPRRSAKPSVPESVQISCICASPITMVPFTGNHEVMIPINVGRDPAGGLVIVGSSAGYTIRPLNEGEDPDGRFRRRAHWDTCPHRGRWRKVMLAVGIDGGPSASDPARIGPCVRCRQHHPWRYGGPVASPVCDRCRAEDGRPLMGEYD